MNEYIYNEDNSYIYKKTVNGIDYSLVYRPTDLLVKQEIGNGKDPKRILELRKKYRKHIYFNLSMSKNDKELLNDVAGDKQKFSDMVTDLVFGMQEKVHLFTPTKDTIEMTDFIYPRMYGMTNATTIMFVYPRNEKMLNESYLNFTIEDLGFYTGEVKFKIETKPLRSEPKINF
jgi:hypothetical protein